MVVEKRGGKVKCSKMLRVPRSICGKKTVQSMAHYNYDLLPKIFFLQSASSIWGLLISQGMPPEFLDELTEGMREAKRRMGEEDREGERVMK